MVKKYIVDIEVEETDIEVEAENEADASEKAYEYFTTYLFQGDCTFRIRKVEEDETVIKEAIAPLDDIIEVGPLEAKRIIETRTPIGKYLHEDGLMFVAIDNTTSNAWTEEFENKYDATAWLKDTSLNRPELTFSYDKVLEQSDDGA